MNLTVASDVFREMLDAARTAAPLEACGLLAGNVDRVTKCYVLTNADASREHFSLKPEEQFAAVKDMRAHGLNLLAIWHSHPETPARMSEEDMRLAYTPDVIYVILSLACSGNPDLRGYAVENGRPVPAEINLTE